MLIVVVAFIVAITLITLSITHRRQSDFVDPYTCCIHAMQTQMSSAPLLCHTWTIGHCRWQIPYESIENDFQKWFGSLNAVFNCRYIECVGILNRTHTRTHFFIQMSMTKAITWKNLKLNYGWKNYDWPWKWKRNRIEKPSTNANTWNEHKHERAISTQNTIMNANGIETYTQPIRLI